MALSKVLPKKLLPPGAQVRPFEVRVLGMENRPTYRSIKSNFTVDKNSPKDSRFILSEMVQNSLSLEAEEERRFRERVQSEVERLRADVTREARAEGFEAGHKEGLKKAYEEERSRLAALIEGLAHAIEGIAKAKASLSKDYELRLVQLAFKMASVVVDHQVNTHPELVAHSVRAILDKIGQDEDVRIRLSAEDHGVIQQVQEEIKKVSHRGRISFDLDYGLARGDCVVESMSGEIASFIEEKLAKLKEELKKTYPDIDSLESKKTGT
jgi:flagellar assembly protein FliH